MSPTYGHVTELFLESEFQRKGNEQTENANSQHNIAVFSAAIGSENEIIQILHKKEDKSKIGQNCHRQDRYLPLKAHISQ